MKTLSYFERLEKHSAFFSPTGNGTIEEYQLKRDPKTGEESLVCVGIRNIYEEIQAFKESTDISNIIERFVNGETDVLHQVDGVYADVSDAPTSYADYFNKVKEAEKIFESLPEDIKDKFDNSAEKFFLEFGTDSFNDKVSDASNVEDVNESMNVIKEDFDNAE